MKKSFVKIETPKSEKEFFKNNNEFKELDKEKGANRKLDEYQEKIKIMDPAGPLKLFVGDREDLPGISEDRLNGLGFGVKVQVGQVRLGAGKVKNIKGLANQIKNNNGTPLVGYKGGKKYNNMPKKDGDQKLPEGVSYKEYDVKPYVKDKSRGSERIVIGNDGSVWYTRDHYSTFIKIK